MERNAVFNDKNGASLDLVLATLNLLCRYVFSGAWSAVLFSWLVLIWSLQYMYRALDRFLRVHNIDASKYVPKRISQPDGPGAAGGNEGFHMVTRGTWGQDDGRDKEPDVEAQPQPRTDGAPWYSLASIREKVTGKPAQQQQQLVGIDATAVNENVWDAEADPHHRDDGFLAAPDPSLGRAPAGLR